MLRRILLAVPMALCLCFCFCSASFGEDKDGEWTAVVTVKDDMVMAKVGDKDFVLTGDEAKKIKEGGKFVVKGKISDDGKSIVTTEIKKAE